MSYAAFMNANEFKNRTKAFAIRVIRLVEALPKNQTAKVIGNQLLRCGTSVGANYRAACRARSPADFIARMAIVEEECHEGGSDAFSHHRPCFQTCENGRPAQSIDIKGIAQPDELRTSS